MPVLAPGPPPTNHPPTTSGTPWALIAIGITFWAAVYLYGDTRIIRTLTTIALAVGVVYWRHTIRRRP